MFRKMVVMQIMRDFPGRDVRSNSLFNSFLGLFDKWLYVTPPDGYKKDIKILEIYIKISSITFSVWKYLFQHGTIIQTGIAYKKIPCHLRDSACRRFIVKKN